MRLWHLNVRPARCCKFATSFDGEPHYTTLSCVASALKMPERVCCFPVLVLRLLHRQIATVTLTHCIARPLVFVLFHFGPVLEQRAWPAAVARFTAAVLIDYVTVLWRSSVVCLYVWHACSHVKSHFRASLRVFARFRVLLRILEVFCAFSRISA